MIGAAACDPEEGSAAAVCAAAEFLGMVIEEAHLAGVIANLRILQRHARAVLEFRACDEPFTEEFRP